MLRASPCLTPQSVRKKRKFPWSHGSCEEEDLPAVSRLSLAVVYTTVAVDVLAMSMASPIMVPFCKALGASASMIGLQFSIASAADIASNLWMPPFSDTFGRRPTFLLSLAVSGVALLAQSQATSFRLLICFRFMSEFVGGCQPAAYAYMVDVAPTERERASFSAVIPVVVSVTFAVGPIIGGALAAEGGFRFPLFMSGILSLAAFFTGFASLEEPRAIEPMDPDSTQEAGPSAWTQPKFVAIGIASALHQAAFAALQVLLPFVLSNKAIFPTLTVERVTNLTGIMFGVMAAVMAPFMLFAYERVALVLGYNLAAGIGALLTSSAMMLLSVVVQWDWSAHDLIKMLALVVSLAGIGFGMVDPTLALRMTRDVPPDRVARTLSVKQTLDATARAIGPMATLLIKPDGVAYALFVSALSALLASGAILGVGVWDYHSDQDDDQDDCSDSHFATPKSTNQQRTKPGGDYGSMLTSTRVEMGEIRI